MIVIHSKHNNTHKNEMFYALISINNHVIYIHNRIGVRRSSFFFPLYPSVYTYITIVICSYITLIIYPSVFFPHSLFSLSPTTLFFLSPPLSFFSLSPTTLFFLSPRRLSFFSLPDSRPAFLKNSENLRRRCVLVFSLFSFSFFELSLSLPFFYVFRPLSLSRFSFPFF